MRVCLLTLCILLILSACHNDNFQTYEHLSANELASGKREDSLFMGIYLGMKSKDFYTHCWDLNRKGIFTDGQNNNAVLYHLNKGQLRYKTSLNFYPAFINGKIYKMKATFNYDAWAPWNKSMMSDSLLPDVLRLFAKWYPDGNPFLPLQDKERGTIYVKVDGNRRIVVGKYDDMRVKVDYTDLLTEQAMNR